MILGMVTSLCGFAMICLEIVVRVDIDDYVGRVFLGLIFAALWCWVNDIHFSIELPNMREESQA
jgi:hypothetical protein